MFAALATLSACASGPCSSSDLRKVNQALGSVPKQHHVQLAAQGLVESCTFPPPVAEALQAVAQVPPDMVRLVDVRVAADAPELWSAACPGGPGALATTMQAAPADGRRHLFEACALDRHGWSADRFARGNGPVVLPIVLAELMKGHSVLDRTVVLDALAGL